MTVEQPETPEQKPERFVHLRFVLKRLVQYEIVILALIVAICVIGGVRGAQAISTVIMVVGIIVVAAGPMSMIGGWGQTRSFSYQYSQSMTGERIDKRAARHKADMEQSTGVMGPSCLLGTLTIIISVIFALIFGG